MYNSTQGQSVNTDKRWMERIEGSKKLSEFNIPGTHESCAFHEKLSLGFAKCQDLTLEEQLNAGIRFIDIRCRHIDDIFTIHHGSIYQNNNFDNVLRNCNSFLETNPTECIVMSVKEEYVPEKTTRSFVQTFDFYVQKSLSSWYLDNIIPTLDSVRGKIVLFRRFGGSSQGIDASANWGDNTTFTINTSPNVTLEIQDRYESKQEDKWNAVQDHLNKAKAAPISHWYINFLSGYFKVDVSLSWRPITLPTTPKGMAEYINPKMMEYLNSHSSSSLKRYGTILMDFAKNDLIAKIISSNFM